MSLLVFAVSVLLITLSSFSMFKGRAWGYCYFFNITASTAIFYAFLNLPEFSSKGVNTIAGLTFGVYISHANTHLQNIVYHKCMHTERYLDNPMMPIHFAVCIVLQFAFFASIEYLRQLAWRPTVGRWIMRSKLLQAEKDWELRIFEDHSAHA